MEIFQYGSSPINSWFYTSGSGVDTDTTIPRIEERQADGGDNDGKILFAAVQNANGVYAAVIYDADASNGGKKGAATVTATCNGRSCSAGDFVVAVDAAATSGGSPVTMSWVNCCESGFVLGPFSASQSVCFQHSALSGVSAARFVTGGQTRTYYSITGDASAGEICIVFA
jgi:hypothetical protein